MKRVPWFWTIGCTLGLLAIPARAVTIWSDDFSSSTFGAAPTRDFTSNTTNDHTIAGSTTIVTGTSGDASTYILSQTDTSTSGSTTSSIFSNQFATFSLNATNNLLHIAYDFRVDSFVSTDGASLPRFILRNASSSNNQFAVGLSYAAIDGDAGSDLAFFAGNSASSGVPNTSGNAIGYNSGSSSWLSGFDFGEYNSGAAASNDSNDEFYHFDFTYDFVTGGVSGSVANVANPTQTASFSRTFTAGLAFSTNNVSGLILATGQTGTSVNYYDNIVVDIVPEPMTAMSFLGGAGLLLWRRPRRGGRPA